MADRPRLLLLINSLEGGGAEKVMARLSGELAALLGNVDIRLALLDDVPATVGVDPKVDVVRLDCRGSMLRSIATTRRLIAEWRPAAVLSFLTRANCAAILANRSRQFRCVISERVNTTSHLGSRFQGRLLRSIVARLYPQADVVIAVSQGVGDELVRRYRVPAERLSVIHNPIDIPTVRARAAEVPSIALPADYFVSVGRLVPNKGGDVLLRAFAQHRNRDRALVILGDGPERDALHSLARDLGIAGRVHLPGFVDNPHAIVARATAYIASSRSEGFPNALVEAMALGRPVAATDCPSGPAEVLAECTTDTTSCRNGGNWGLLVPVDDVPALANAMDRFDDDAVRQVFGQRAATRADALFAEPAVERYAQALGFLQ